MRYSTIPPSAWPAVLCLIGGPSNVWGAIREPPALASTAIAVAALALLAVAAWRYHNTAIAAARADAERYADFVSAAADWAWALDSELRFSHLGERDADNLVRPNDAIIGRRRSEIYADQIAANPEHWRAHLQDLEAHRAFSDFEIDWRRPDGERCVVLSTGKPIFDAKGEFRGYRGMVHDITELRIAQEQLASAKASLETRVVERTRELSDSEARFRDFAQTATDCLWETDEHLRYTFLSGPDEDILGVSSDELLGRSIGELCAAQIEEDPEHWQRLFDDVRARLPFQDFEMQWRRPDGGARILLSSGKPIFGDDGGFRGYRGAVRDVTERRRTVERSRRHLQELAHASRLAVMGEMALGMAHELSQPLTAIVTAAEAASRSLTNKSAQRPELLGDALQTCVAQGQRAGHILRRLRDFVHKKHVESRSIDINSAVKDALSLIDHEFREHRIKVCLELDETLPTVRGDEIQIEQVTLNLVRNAIDAMSDIKPEARTLAVATRRTANGSVEVSVTDTGAGLTDETRERVFETFFSTKSEGMGMGLAISRSIIEAHGGKLWADPPAPEGATFRFNLALAEASSLLKKPQASAR